MVNFPNNDEPHKVLQILIQKNEYHMVFDDPFIKHYEILSNYLESLAIIPENTLYPVLYGENYVVFGMGQCFYVDSEKRMYLFGNSTYYQKSYSKEFCKQIQPYIDFSFQFLSS